MSGLYTTKKRDSVRKSLGEELRALRDQLGRRGWEVAPEAGMDTGLLSKIENGRRFVTQTQLAALAKYFKVPLGPLEAKRVAEEMLRKFGDHPQLAEAAAMVQESVGEYHVKKVSTTVNKPPGAVNKRKKVR